jgi:23S rRNA pseudouridine2605 synthase
MKKRSRKRSKPGTFDPNSKPGKARSPEYQFLRKPKKEESSVSVIRLNKFIANSGICSRREADVLILNGDIRVNGKVVFELGTKIKPSDKIQYKGKVLRREKFIYILLNKPKDFITTTDDPQKRKTVIDLVKNHIPERVFPVGRLDRNTTGLLILTNDGELSEILAHPSYNIKKVYEVHLDKPVQQDDIDAMDKGIVLEDGPVKIDALEVISPDARTIGIEIHSGRNRIVRRIFESLGYKVVRLDRVMYSFLTKKDLPRGKWRFLKEFEVIRLKQLGKKRKRQ